ncbi:MAG: DUF5689 domain-containing protein [Muribaculaceae bacterium]
MKKTILYIASLLLASTGIMSCDDDFERIPVQVPEATWVANTTIADLKINNWSDERNYANEIGLTESGEHTVIKGRVISSDETGNIYKNFVIDDGTGALTVSVNMKNIYQSYLRGQEVVMDVTGLHIGKYNGMLQLGAPEWYDKGNCWEVTFMEQEVLEAHAQQNGLANLAAIDTMVVTIPELNEIKKDNEKFVGMISRLVKFENVRWEDGGKEFAGTANANRYLIDAEGNKILFRNSAYSDFSYDILPYGMGDVVAILGVYGTDWQLSLIDSAGLQNFDPNAGPEDVPGYAKFQKVAHVTAGKQYLLVADGTKMAKPVAAGKGYDWLYVSDVTATDDVIIENESNAFTFAASGAGYTIQQSDGRYLYLQGTYNSFQVSEEVSEADAAASIWTVEPQDDGTVKITNAVMGKWMQYSSSHSSYGAYDSDQDGGYRPVLYEKVEK